MKTTFTNDSATIGSSEYSLPADSTSLAAQTDDCILEGWIDLANMAAGDEYQIKLYEKINGGTARVVWSAYPVGAQPGPIVVPRYYLGEGWDLTVKKIAGTDRSIAWSLRKQVEGETVVVGSITAGAIDAAAIATGAIDADAIADNAIDAGAIASDAITAAKIATGAITSAKFAAGAIDAAAIATGAIDADAIADNAIDAGAIASGAITAAKFAAGAIDAAAIADNAIDAGAIAADAITAAKIATGAIDADAIAADAITAAKIAADAITAAKIATGTITSAKFAAGAIDAAAIATDAIDADAIAASAVTELQSGMATSAQVDTLEASAAAIEADTQDIQSRLPAALVTGRMDSYVGEMGTDTLTAGAVAASAVTELQSGLALSTQVDTLEASAAAIEADTQDIQGRLPAALVGGRIDASVGAMATDTLTATALAASAVTEIQSGLALSTQVDALETGVAAIEVDTQDIQGRLPAALVGGRMDSSIGAVAANAITAAGIAADVTTELQAGLATAAAQTTAQASLTAIEADTQDIQGRLPAALVSGRIDSSVGAMAANTVTASAVAADAVAELQSGIAMSTQVDTLEASVAAIEVDTQDIQGRLPAALVGGRMDSSVGAMAANVVTAAALATDAVTEAVAAVFNYAVRSGVSFVGIMRRLHALTAGKASGLNGGTARFYDVDETTVLIEAEQNVVTGARDKATIAGD